MIGVKVKDDTLEKLASDLKKLENTLRELSYDAINQFEREIRTEFERSIESLVYDKYEPIHYDRTGHLQGEHGGTVEEIQAFSDNLEYSFEVDGSSRDPVDGTTWDEKAYKIEHGSSMMSYPNHSDRPFVDITAQRIETKGESISNKFIRDVEREIRKLE